MMKNNGTKEKGKSGTKEKGKSGTSHREHLGHQGLKFWNNFILFILDIRSF